MNYNMQGMTKTLVEVFAMLKTVEDEIKKEHTVLMVNKTTNFKKPGQKGKDKGKKPKKDGKFVANTSKTTKPGPKPGTSCFYCKGDGHWKRNCPKYLEDKRGKIAAKDKGICDIHVIDVFLTSSRSNT